MVEQRRRKTSQKGLMGRPAQQIHWRQLGSKKKAVQQHQPHGRHHCGPVARLMGPGQPLPLGTPTVPLSHSPQPQLPALHPRVHPAPEPAWLTPCSPADNSSAPSSQAPNPALLQAGQHRGHRRCGWPTRARPPDPRSMATARAPTHPHLWHHHHEGDHKLGQLPKKTRSYDIAQGRKNSRWSQQAVPWWFKQ